MRLKDKIAIVTGGGSGFGAGIVAKFVAEGAKVIVADRNGEGAVQIARLHGNAAHPVTADVSVAVDVERMVQTGVDAFGRIDILVNNAGMGHPQQPLEALDESTFDRINNVNIKSIYLTARSLVPRFKAQKGGVILNIASTGAISPRPGLTWYNASKGWVITATRSMALELAPSGIRVNAINPVAAETPLLRALVGPDTPETREKLLATIPLGRFCTPDDIGSAATFLCSDEASLITGIAIEVDGGRCI